MRILTIVQGRYGQRITANLQQANIPSWTVDSWTLPTVLPPVIDYPEEYLPAELPTADLLLALGEHPGVAELLPDIVQMCGARAVIAPIDNGAWMPPGLVRQLAGWLAALSVPVVFPKPFCSLTETSYNAYRRQVGYEVPLVAEFARHFGHPVIHLTVDADETTVNGAQVMRDTPCGCARHIAEGLIGVSVDEAEYEAGMLHHHYPCLAGMAIDPDYNDTLMHVSGHILRDEVDRSVEAYRRSPIYLRPPGRSD